MRIAADSELIRRVQAAKGEQAVVNILPEAPLAFALDEGTSLTRARATHVRTVHFGLRQIYHAIARVEHARPGGLTPTGAARRLAAAPAEMFGPVADPIELDFLLMGDCTDEGVVAEMRGFVDAAGPAPRVGLFHWPDFAAEPAELSAGYCDLLARPGVVAVLPGSRVRLASRYGVFFGCNHAEVDMPPEIVP